MKANSEQQKAIQHIAGPMLVLAGPGSGKTYVITQRVQYLTEQGVDPRSILVITFTRAAAREMEMRYQKLGARGGITFGTFHKIFFMILKHAYGYRGDQILREEEKERWFREIVEKMEPETDDMTETIREMIQEVSYVKGEGLEVSHYYPLSCAQGFFQKVYETYASRLRREDKIDFDDMLLYCEQLLRERKDILAGWQARYRYILVDEAQDSNRLQYRIVRMLAGRSQNLMLVGDDDQSLYRFRGAKPELLLGFLKDFPKGKMVMLSTNYRSNQTIVEGALRVIVHNQTRYPKKLQAARGAVDHCIQIHACEDGRAEESAITACLREYHAQGIPYREMAVLYRTNTQPRGLVQQCLYENLPFTMKDALPDLFAHWISRDILAYIQVARGNWKRQDVLRIMNRPLRYISREALEESGGDGELLLQFYRDKPYMQERVRKLFQELAMIRQLGPLGAVHYIRHVVGYETFLKGYATERHVQPEEWLELLDELQESAGEYRTMEEWFAYMETYREELARQKKQEDKREGVAFMTFHGAKGLEFQVVCILDAAEGLTPYKRALSIQEVEEERRMFYVAMTRSREYLHMFWPKVRFGKAQSPSRFLEEYGGEGGRVKTGDKITHARFGPGVILKADREKLRIRFDDGQVRVLSAEICQKKGLLQISG